MNAMNDYFYMKMALIEAEKAFFEAEVPVGAVVVWQEKIIAKSRNMCEKLCDATAHAEMLALTAAFTATGSKNLSECTLYVTLEPCVMCAGALFWSQIGELVYAAPEKKRGFSHCSPPLLHPKTKVRSGIMEAEAAALLKTFFQKLR